MKSSDIRDHNIDQHMQSVQQYDRRTYLTLAFTIWIVLLVAFVFLPLLHIDVLSPPGLGVLGITTAISWLIWRWLFSRPRKRMSYPTVAFAGPRWDAQLAEPVHIEYEQSCFFVDNAPVMRLNSQDEWVGLELKSGMTTYVHAEDLKSIVNMEHAAKKPHR